jgi:hypothetical protein
MFAIYVQRTRLLPLRLLPLACGLAAALAAALVLAPSPPPQVPGTNPLLRSLTYLTSTVALAVTAFLISHKVSSARRPLAPAVRLGGVAVWVSLTVACYKLGYNLAAAAAAACVTANIRACLELSPASPSQADITQTGTFADVAAGGMSSRLILSVAGAACVQAAFVGAAAGVHSGIVLLLGAAAGGVLAQAWQQEPKTRLRTVLVTLCGVPAFLFVSMGGAAGREFHLGASQDADQRHGSRAGLRSADLVSAIVLLPVSQPSVKLVAPIALLPITRARVAVVPEVVNKFSGEYWILPMGHMRPPEDAVVERAAPTDFHFNAVDRSPLMMLAKQSLPGPVPVQCCRRLRVTVRNLDRRPDTVALQVNLVASKDGRRLREPLGAVTLTESPSAILDYLFPASSRLLAFDELEFYFHLLGDRKHRSANVDIVGFEFTRR